MTFCSHHCYCWHSCHIWYICQGHTLAFWFWRVPDTICLKRIMKWIINYCSLLGHNPHTLHSEKRQGVLGMILKPFCSTVQFQPWCHPFYLVKVFVSPLFCLIEFGHFRSFVYDFIVITKYKIMALLILLNVLHVISCAQCNHHNCPHTFPICVVNSQLQLCTYPCSDSVKKQWQHCWYRLPDSSSLLQRCFFTLANNKHSRGARSGESEGCSSTSQPQHSTRFCTSQWWWGVAWSWSKMTPCSSNSGCVQWRTRLTSSCRSAR